MTRFAKISDSVGRHPIIIFASAVAAIIQLVLWALKAANVITNLRINTMLVSNGAFIALGVGLYGIVRILRENQRLKEVYAKIHDLNHLYRQTLAETSARLLTVAQADGQIANQILLETEEKTIMTISQIVSAIFRLLVGKDVVTTVWLFDAKSQSCREYVCSHQRIDSLRHLHDRKAYSTTGNSIFSDCKQKKGKCCHFFSPDLEHTASSDGGYEDERPHYGELYQSILCVPIRFATSSGEDRLGYLQIDSKSRYQLNDTEHLHLISAFADQLYNFLSLVRRNYLFS